MKKLFKCNKCGRKTTIKGNLFNSLEGTHQTCLSCGWHETQEYLEDEEVLENYQEQYKEEFDYLMKKRLIEGYE